jgi:hypothetical protein
MDLRRINPSNTPYIAGLFESYPWVKIRSFPNSDLVPTLLTGVYPHEHGCWQVRLRARPKSTMGQIVIDKMPDILTTTVQCLVHLFNHSFDLATIPARRLRHFEIKRFKDTRHYFPSLREFFSRLSFNMSFDHASPRKWDVNLLTIGGIKTIFGIVGKDNSSFVFNRKFSELKKLIHRACSGNCRLEFLELHSLDIFEHWNLHDSAKTNQFYLAVDNFIKNLHGKCKQKAIPLMLLSDHGQEHVKGSIDIKEGLSRLDLSNDEFKFYLEAPMARFWFHTDRARKKITDMLSSLGHGTVLSYKDMHDYNIKFDDNRYGEVYFIADPGYIIFPNDFHHPLANLFLGLTDWQQRSRIFHPEHRSSHGYLPQYESEKGFMIVLDRSYKVYGEPEFDVIDVAPSILALMGYKNTEQMKGSSVFKI